MQLDEQHLHSRDVMASLSATVDIITTEGDAGQYGITATAVCSVTDALPSLMVCINANSAINPVFQGSGELCANVPDHEQELMARHFADTTDVAMKGRFSLSCRQKGPSARPVSKSSLASFEGEIRDVQVIGTRLVYLVEIENIVLSTEGHGFIYLRRRFHLVMPRTGAAI